MISVLYDIIIWYWWPSNPIPFDAYVGGSGLGQRPIVYDNAYEIMSMIIYEGNGMPFITIGRKRNFIWKKCEMRIAFWEWEGMGLKNHSHDYF